MRERIGEVTLALTLKSRTLRSGLRPLYIRVQHRSANRYYSAHGEMTPEEFARFEKAPDSDHPSMQTYRTFLEAIRKLVREGDFSFDALSRLTNRKRGDTVQELVRERAAEIRLTGKHNTADIYDNLAGNLDEFLGGARLPVSQVTAERCRRFLEWLATARRNNPTTVGIKARALAATLSRAASAHLIPANPMEGVRRPAPLRRDMAVSEASLHKLLHATEDEIGTENLYWLNFWRAIYYGNGMNVRDLLQLHRSDFRTDTAEIVFVRRKTADSSGAAVHVALIPELNDALSAIAGGTGHIVPILDGYEPGSLEEHKRIRQTVKNINAHLRETCRLLRIPEKVTTYTGRHCFATRLQQSGAPVEFISAALGHASIRTTQNYLDGYTSEQRRKKAQLLKA